MQAGWGVLPAPAESPECGVVQAPGNVVDGMYVPSVRRAPVSSRRWSARAAAGGAANYIRTVRTPGSRMRGAPSASNSLGMMGDLSLARAIAAMSMENEATPSSTFGTAPSSHAGPSSHSMLPKRSSFTRILSKFQRSSTLGSADGSTARPEDGADRLANLQRKRSAREERARPWAGALANKKKNRARLMRRNAFSKNVMLDVESLRAHISVRLVLSTFHSPGCQGQTGGLRFTGALHRALPFTRSLTWCAVYLVFF